MDRGALNKTEKKRGIFPSLFSHCSLTVSPRKISLQRPAAVTWPQRLAEISFADQLWLNCGQLRQSQGEPSTSSRMEVVRMEKKNRFRLRARTADLLHYSEGNLESLKASSAWGTRQFTSKMTVGYVSCSFIRFQWSLLHRYRAIIYSFNTWNYTLLFKILPKDTVETTVPRKESKSTY